MARTRKYINFEEKPKQEESAAHKNRRDSKQLTRTYADYFDEVASIDDLDELYEEEDLVTFERIKKNH